MKKLLLISLLSCVVSNNLTMVPALKSNQDLISNLREESEYMSQKLTQTQQITNLKDNGKEDNLLVKALKKVNWHNIKRIVMIIINFSLNKIHLCIGG